MGIPHTQEYMAAMIAVVCQSIREGMTARKACQLHGVEFPTMKLWCSKDPDFAAQYQAAREALYEHWEEDIVDIADDQQSGSIIKDGPLGRSIETKDMIEHRKLRIDSRKWLLARRVPKVFGDKMALGGADDLPPIQTKADINLSAEEAYKQMLGVGNGRS